MMNDSYRNPRELRRATGAPTCFEKFFSTVKKLRRLTAQRGVGAVISIVWVLGANPAQGAGTDLERFIGTYAGDYVTEPVGLVKPGDLHLRFQTQGEGFKLDWQSLADTDEKPKHHDNVSFVPTHRDNIYLAVMRCDMFGNLEPLDPMRGEPFMWASIEGNRLNVYVMLIGERGTHDLRIYRYLLKDGTMTLSFERQSDEDRIQKISGSLKKTPVMDKSSASMPPATVKDHRMPECG